VDLLSIASSRASARLFQLAFWTCLLFPVALSASYAQTTTTPANNQDSNPLDFQDYCSQPASTGDPNCASMKPSSVPARPQGEVDISSPRTQDRTPYQDRTQPSDRTLPQERTRRSTQLTPPPPPTEFQRIVTESSGRTLPIFGASLFTAAPSTFAPVDNIPVTPDYVIGPGDEIRLQVWGQVNQRGTFVVDRTGSISLPQVGTIQVAGLQFSQLSDFIKSQLGRVYRNFDLNVNLGQLRSIQVFVVGQARQPGSYTVGSLSTLLNALFASGGPLPQGSLRDIQLRRGNETVTHFDLYDLLLHGDKSKDVRLASGDVIFIPDVGPQVAVVGSVTTPAIYELRGEKSFNQVIALAGGPTSVAASSRVWVERIDNHSVRSMLDFDPAAPDTPPVKNGDIITINSILGRFENAVTLRGNVANPGRYTWHEGMRISDLIPSREALVTRNYYRRHNQLGLPSSDYTASRPEGALNLQSNQPNEIVSNRITPQSTSNGATSNNGAIRNDGTSITPGSNTSMNSSTNSNVAATSSSAGGSSVGAATAATNNNFSAVNDVVLPAPDIDWEYAVIERQNASDLTTSLVPFNLGKAIVDKDTSQNLPLLAGDIVTVFSKADIRVPSMQQTKFVKLEGEFQSAGVYSVLPGETLRQLIARAGGLTPDADLFASEYTRETVRRLQRQRLLEYADDLEQQITANSSASASAALSDRDAAAAAAAANASRALVARLREVQPTGRIVLQLKPESAGVTALPDLPLQDGDRFIVPKTPSTVTVEGQVYNANAFLYQKGRRVRDYIRLAGGPDRIGDRKREFILRADGSVVSRQYENSSIRSIYQASNSFDNTILYPGDTIVVPPVLQKGAFMRNLANIATIVGGFGIGAAAISNIL
jgi:polysaccharide biosynthesis/export protein